MLNLFFLLSFSSYIVNLTKAAISSRQYQELINFYQTTNGDEWSWEDSTPWDLTTDPCIDSWTGVQCNSSVSICQIEVCGVRSINLEQFGLKNNLPNTFGVMTDLQLLVLSDNNLCGPLPSVLGDLVQLSILSLGSNSFSSSIPSEIGKLSELRVLDLSSNRLIGTLPSTLNTLSFGSTMTALYLGDNKICGSFPSLVSFMPNLQYFSLNMNYFTGTIPSFVCPLTKLRALGLGSNKFYGSLPTCLNTFSKLEYFHATNNSFIGPLPLLELSSNLTYFQVNGNHFNGKISSKFGYFSKLKVLEVGRNSLTGTLPNELSLLTSLQTLYLHKNTLSGTLPSLIGNMKSLEFFILFENNFFGTIPFSVGSLVNLRELVLHTNSFHGRLPSSLVHLTNLRVFLIQNNQFIDFSQPVDGLFLNPALQHIDISNNRFDGPLSKIPFTSFPNLKTFAAVKNCFTGTLPDDICSPKEIEVLALDGLASGLSCRTHFYDPFHLTDTYLTQSLEGKIPTCVWSLPNLTVLHLSGNGLTGSLPSHIPTTSKLINISFAHNRLTGTIPTFLLKNPYLELCLGYNKFTGSLEKNDFYSSPSSAATEKEEEEDQRLILSVENNRLSGYLPSHLNLIPKLTILQGNLWNCDNHHTLPENDPRNGDYVCGSQQLDQSLILWCSVVGVWVIVLIGVIYITCQNPESRFRVVNEMTNRVKSIQSSTATPTTVAATTTSPTTTRGSEMTESETVGSPTKVYDNANHPLHGYTNPTHNLPIPSTSTTTITTSPTTISFSDWIQSIIRWNHFGKIQSVHILTKQLNLNLSSLKIFLSLLSMIRKTYSIIGILILFIGLPLYVSLKTKYATHEYQYGWILSAAYMSGLLPSILLLVFYVIVTCVVGYSFVSLYPVTHPEEFPSRYTAALSREPSLTHSNSNHSLLNQFLTKTSSHNTNEEEIKSTTQSIPRPTTPSTSYRHRILQCVVYLTVISINILVFLSANSLYVYLLLSGSKYTYRIFAKLGIAVFSLFWNMFFLPSLLDSASQSINDNINQYKWILIFLLLINNIAIPGLASAVSDSSCFDDLFIYQDKIVAYYSYMYCELYSTSPVAAMATTVAAVSSYQHHDDPTGCLQYSIVGVSTSYSPPFFYNYSCASAILQNYIPVYFITYSLITIVPLLAFLLFHSPWEISSYLPQWGLNFIPYLWRSPSTYPFQFKYNSQQLFKPNRIICNTLSHLAVMMTFGTAFPLLAVSIVIAVCIVTWYHELTIGRYLEYRFFLYSTISSISQTTTRETMTDLTGGINVSCYDVISGLSASLWVILIGSSLVFSFMIFDFSGDKVSSSSTAILLGAMACLLPIVFGWLSFKFALYYHTKYNNSYQYELLSPGIGGDEEDEENEEFVDI